MRPTHTLLPLLALALLGLSGCLVSPLAGQEILEGSGTLAEENRTVDRITRVQLGAPATLHIEIGSIESLRVSADDNLLPYLEAEVRGGELDLRVRPGVNVRPRQPIDFYLTVPALERIRITSSGDVEAPDLAAPHFEATITSSGSMTIAGLQAETLDVEITSSGRLTILGGSAENQTIRISSSGDYDAKAVQSKRASVRLTSSGSATLQVLERLDADLSSSGNVYYLGSPEVSVDTSSSGKAIPISE
jgi:Putative auto-transporter adhesin, head GIN domain